MPLFMTSPFLTKVKIYLVKISLEIGQLRFYICYGFAFITNVTAW